MADLREKDGERSLANYDLFDRVGMWRVHRDAVAVGAGIFTRHRRCTQI
ncbi:MULTISPECIES: hypothetical protein [unclassified Mesorhizobium]|nr:MULTISPECIES: hypothetical protein [unclassified Mesorhizobium]